MALHNDFGKLAEDFAAEWLESKGYKIIARNFRYQKAEIDIIALEGETLVIFEVKARANNRTTEPQEAVTRKKIKLLVQAADHFLDEFKPVSVRFDVITLLGEENDLKINHIINAFESIDF